MKTTVAGSTITPGTAHLTAQARPHLDELRIYRDQIHMRRLLGDEGVPRDRPRRRDLHIPNTFCLGKVTTITGHASIIVSATYWQIVDCYLGFIVWMWLLRSGACRVPVTLPVRGRRDPNLAEAVRTLSTTFAYGLTTSKFSEFMRFFWLVHFSHRNFSPKVGLDCVVLQRLFLCVALPFFSASLCYLQLSLDHQKLHHVTTRERMIKHHEAAGRGRYD
jgi:hypothetical protein